MKHIERYYIGTDYIKILGRDSNWLTNCDKFCIFSQFIPYSNEWESVKSWPSIFFLQGRISGCVYLEGHGMSYLKFQVSRKDKFINFLSSGRPSIA